MVTATGIASPIAVNNLIGGNNYKYAVTAQNAAGSSVPSNSVNATPSGLPTPPGASILSSMVWSKLLFAFVEPTYTGYVPLTGNTGTCTSTTSPYTKSADWPSMSAIRGISDLPPNDTYNCYMTSTNSIGTGPASNI